MPKDGTNQVDERTMTDNVIRWMHGKLDESIAERAHAIARVTAIDDRIADIERLISALGVILKNEETTRCSTETPAIRSHADDLVKIMLVEDRPWTTRELVDRLDAIGHPLPHSKSSRAASIHSVLRRRGTLFVKVGNAKWALVGSKTAEMDSQPRKGIQRAGRVARHHAAAEGDSG